MKASFHKFTAALLAACLFTLLACSSDDGGSSVVYGPTVSYGGEDYQTVVIGTQTWFARNLNYDVSGSKCYDNLESNCNKYGKLYNWATAMALPSSCNESSCSSQISTKHKGICPSGWHLPTDTEWETLINYVDSEDGRDRGKKLRAKSDDWADGWNDGTDDYGFSALPGGEVWADGSFQNAGFGFWWSSTEFFPKYYEDKAYSWKYNGKWDSDFKSYLHSIRCLKDN